MGPALVGVLASPFSDSVVDPSLMLTGDIMPRVLDSSSTSILICGEGIGASSGVLGRRFDADGGVGTEVVRTGASAASAFRRI